MKKHFIFFIILLAFIPSIKAQDWTLKLSSNVELRTWTLTSVSRISEKALSGASIKLYKETTLISETTSDPNGDFVIDVPAKGDFILTVSFEGCNTKKFFVTTNSVPDELGKANYKPTVGIGGFVMSKPIKDVDYIGLNEPLVKVEYKDKGKNFDRDDAVTAKGLEIVTKIYNSEKSIIEKFCAANKMGDDALKKDNCALAKNCYLKAMNLMPGEEYPVERLKAVEGCLSKKEGMVQDAADAAAAKAEAHKVASEKHQANKTAQHKASFEKAGNASAAKQKATANKGQKTTTEKSAASSTSMAITYEKKSKSEATLKTSTERNAKYKMAPVLDPNKYKESIASADNYFKTKRYAEARTAYEEALKHKEKDTYSAGRISECDKLLSQKKKEN